MGHALVTSDEVPVVPERRLSLNVYPNPASDLVQIEYELESPARVSLTMLTMDGRRVATIFSGMRPRGKHLLRSSLAELTGAAIPAGQYLILLESEGVRRQSTLIINR